ncbi:MAG TPA: sulfatase [Polyangiaceae bacterium]|nr:sulfatase [Polyangiaceae bacterium]
MPRKEGLRVLGALFVGGLARCLVIATAGSLPACAKGQPSGAPASSAATALPAGDGGTQAAAPSKDANVAGLSKDANVAAPPKNANVIVLSIDSLRADMPWAGYPRPIAPRLTELEARAVSYTHAHSISSYTSMSLGGFLGGRLPSELVRSGYFFGTYRKNVFFPQLLKKAGIHTMGVMAHMYFQSAGFDAGFDDWRLVPGITFDPNTDRDITSPAHEKLAEEMLGDPANASRRFFFWAHFLDPHDQYQRHEGIDWGKSARDRYDGEVTFTDRYVGKLLDFIAKQPWADRTILIVTSDHGEEFGEHNMSRHGFEIWETLTHVPLMVLAPGNAPRRIDVLRSAVDLAPTILAFFGVAPDPSPDPPYEGHSLVREIYGGPAESRDIWVDLPMTSDNGKRRALLHDSEKLLCFDGDTFCKLFDLANDPLEHAPLPHGPEFTAMKARYDEAAKSIQEVAPYACKGDCLNHGYEKKKEGN